LKHHEKQVSEETSPEALARRLEDYFFKRRTGAIIAYSGGVDSSLLAYAAHRSLGNRMLAVLADSPSLARREYGSALRFAEMHRIPLQVVQTQELEDPLYRKNMADRCYHCKKDLFKKLNDLKSRLEHPYGTEWPFFFGMNLDDLGDHRPGHKAAEEAGVFAPYVELGFNKECIRSVCAHYGLEEIAVKAAMPCMASRIAYGETVTAEKLLQVEKAEDLLYDLGFKVYRVRHHGSSARIEVRPEDFTLVLNKRERILERLHALGFTYVSLDLGGFKSGSLNAVLKRKERE